MSKPIHRCELDRPDCFNCPYPECYASVVDINRQEAIRKKEIKHTRINERNKLIIELYKSGKRNCNIINELGVNKNIVGKVIRNYKESLQ